MKKILSLMLSVLLLVSLAACTGGSETPETTPPPFRFMTKNDKGDDLKQLKLYLYRLGYFHTPRLNKDYDSDMIKKVKAFQKNNSLPETGDLDEATYNALISPDAVSAFPTLEIVSVLPEIDWPERDAEGYLVAEEPFLYENDEFR